MGVEKESVLAFVPSALAASQVGTWEADVTNNQTFCDVTMARLFGLDPDEAANGVPFGALMNRIHPEDREAASERAVAVRSHGGLFVLEHRVCPTSTDIRWVLARGRYERNPATGHIVGRGIVIDITESKADWQNEDRASFVMTSGSEPSLDNVATLVLKARDELLELGSQQDGPILSAIDLLLWQIGRALAREQLKEKRRTN